MQSSTRASLPAGQPDGISVEIPGERQQLAAGQSPGQQSYSTDQGAESDGGSSLPSTVGSHAEAPLCHSPPGCEPGPAPARPTTLPVPEPPQVAPGGPGEHIVMVHVGAGETFSVRVGDQLQLVRGPATVRMVSNNGPPLPMPMQVPPGHLVQQIVDENGILTHVILSPQHGPPPHAASAYFPGLPAAHLLPGAPLPYVPASAQAATMPPSPSIFSSQASPGCGGTSLAPDERAERHKGKLQSRAKNRRQQVEALHHQPRRKRTSPRGSLNGDSGYYGGRQQAPRLAHSAPITHRSTPENGVGDSSSSAEEFPDFPGDGDAPEPMDSVPELETLLQQCGIGEEELRQALSSIQAPSVTDIELSSALIQLRAPPADRLPEDLYPSLHFELHLSDCGAAGSYACVFDGQAEEISLQDLKPNREYCVRALAKLGAVKGDFTEAHQFRTLRQAPGPPAALSLAGRSKNSLSVRWAPPAEDNGAKVTGYVLECCGPCTQPADFKVIYRGQQRLFKAPKLVPSSTYWLRVAAVNSEGQGQFTQPVAMATCGVAPTQPEPPALAERDVKALTIQWAQRSSDEEFVLQMEDEATGHGFMTVYSGRDLRHRVPNLRRNTRYRFRLQTANEDGLSKWSAVASYCTLPDRPAPPRRLQLCRPPRPTSFHVCWDPPPDDGGSPLLAYLVQTDPGGVLSDSVPAEQTEYKADGLEPGREYKLTVVCRTSAGVSEASDALTVVTTPLPPEAPEPPRLQGKPRATQLGLCWSAPRHCGGAPVDTYAVSMSWPSEDTASEPGAQSRQVYRGSARECTVSGLAPGHRYAFAVRAANSAGSGPWSEPLEVTSGPGVPDAPACPSVVCRSPHAAAVSWGQPLCHGAAVHEYRLEWQTRPEAEFALLYSGDALTYEAKNLQPATSYWFRVQAVNCAGPGPHSPAAHVATPASSPDPVLAVRTAAQATCVAVSWSPPNCNGSDITGYTLCVNERPPLQLEAGQTEFTIRDLQPDTQYRLRLRACNAVGQGPFSPVHKVTTGPLPPMPPRIECVLNLATSLKLKWGDGRNADLVQYQVEMSTAAGCDEAGQPALRGWQIVYQGTAHSTKLTRLAELTDYHFRLRATNEAGSGPYSAPVRFSTGKAHPPALKPPKLSELTHDTCRVDWGCLRPMGSDTIVYVLQLLTVNDRDCDYRQVYRGSDQSCKLTYLNPNTEYQVRVAAARRCGETGEELMGAFSQGVVFITRAAGRSGGAAAGASDRQLAAEHQDLWSEQRVAAAFLLVFVLLTVLVSLLLKYLVLDA